MLHVDLSTPHCRGPVVAALRGDLDAAAAVDMEAALAVVAAGRPWIIADLAALEFIDCSGMAALARVREKVRQTGGDLLLAAAQEQVLRLLILTGLIGVFPVHASTAHAAAAVGGSPSRAAALGTLRPPS
jgi:anti-sigma B factor antagonist